MTERYTHTLIVVHLIETGVIEQQHRARSIVTVSFLQIYEHMLIINCGLSMGIGQRNVRTCILQHISMTEVNILYNST